jgi:hypothetical protein
MIRRLFWLCVGIGLGAYLFRRVTRTVESYSPAGLAGRAQAGLDSGAAAARSFVATVREIAAEREVELRAAIADDHPRPRRESTPGTGRRRGDGRELRADARSRARSQVEARPADRHGD